MVTLFRLKGDKGTRANPGALVNVRLPHDPDPREEVSTRRVADVLGVSGDTVRKYIADGRLEASTDADSGRYSVRMGEVERFVREELEPVELVEKGANPAPEPAAKAERTPQPRTGNGAQESEATPRLQRREERVQAKPGGFDAACPECGATIRIPAHVLALKCPECGEEFDVVTEDLGQDGKGQNGEGQRRSR